LFLVKIVQSIAAIVFRRSVHLAPSEMMHVVMVVVIAMVVVVIAMVVVTMVAAVAVVVEVAVIVMIVMIVMNAENAGKSVFFRSKISGEMHLSQGWHLPLVYFGWGKPSQ
jgi:hypothetical protein